MHQFFLVLCSKTTFSTSCNCMLLCKVCQNHICGLFSIRYSYSYHSISFSCTEIGHCLICCCIVISTFWHSTTYSHSIYIRLQNFNIVYVELFKFCPQEEPFTSHQPEALFNIARFLTHCLFNEMPVGISKVYPFTQ